MNYNMNNFDKPLPELLNMLRTAEQNLSKGMPVLVIQRVKRKGKGKGKGKQVCIAPKLDADQVESKVCQEWTLLPLRWVWSLAAELQGVFGGDEKEEEEW